MKQFGKAKIYLYNQDLLPSVNEEEINTANGNLDANRKEY